MQIGDFILQFLLFIMEVITYIVFILFMYCTILKIIEWINESQKYIVERVKTLSIKNNTVKGGKND